MRGDDVLQEASAFEAVTRQRVESVERDLDEYKRRINGSLDKIDQRLSNIEDNLNNRPTWGVALLLTALSSMSVGLLVKLAGGG